MITLTRKLAWATATDATTSQMRKSGRIAWDLDDYNLACATFDRLWPLAERKKAVPLPDSEGVNRPQRPQTPAMAITQGGDL